MEHINIDALLPAAIAKKAELVGAQKCRMSFWPLLMLAMLAGAFIAFGAIASTTVSAGAAGQLPFLALQSSCIAPAGTLPAAAWSGSLPWKSRA